MLGRGGLETLRTFILERLPTPSQLLSERVPTPPSPSTLLLLFERVPTPPSITFECLALLTLYIMRKTYSTSSDHLKQLQSMSLQTEALVCKHLSLYSLCQNNALVCKHVQRPFQSVQHCLKKCIDSTSLQEFPSTYAIVFLGMCILNRDEFMQCSL